jgi:hypothetical protein
MGGTMFCSLTTVKKWMLIILIGSIAYTYTISKKKPASHNAESGRKVLQEIFEEIEVLIEKKDQLAKEIIAHQQLEKALKKKLLELYQEEILMCSLKLQKEIPALENLEKLYIPITSSSKKNQNVENKKNSILSLNEKVMILENRIRSLHGNLTKIGILNNIPLSIKINEDSLMQCQEKISTLMLQLEITQKEIDNLMRDFSELEDFIVN